MCCFSQPIRSVTQTTIFARTGPSRHQYLAYSMRLDTPVDVAMILPIPVMSGAGERALRFINLESYPDLFTDLARAFLPPPGRGSQGAVMGAASPQLEVHNVGSFEASY